MVKTVLTILNDMEGVQRFKVGRRGGNNMKERKRMKKKSEKEKDQEYERKREQRNRLRDKKT